MRIDPLVEAALPAKGFLRTYVQEYAVRISDAPEEMALGAALTTLGTVMLKTVWMKWGAGTLHPNLWCIVIGPSTFVRKSTSVNMAVDLLAKVQKLRVGPNQMTVEGIIAHLKDHPAILLPVPEFGVFLSMSKKNYAEGLRQLCMQLADGDRIIRRLKDQLVKCEQHWVSCLAASALPLLDAHTAREDWLGGFMARFIPLTGDKRRSYPTPRTPPPGVQDQLVGLLRERSVRGVPCGGFDEKAKRLFDSWYYQNEARARRAMGLLTQPLFGRLTAAVIKAAVICAYDVEPRRRPGWLIDVPSMRNAIALADIVTKTVDTITRTIAIDRDQRDRNTILAIVREAGPAGITWRELVVRARLLFYRVGLMVESLGHEGLVMKDGDGPLSKVRYASGADATQAGFKTTPKKGGKFAVVE